MSDNYAEETSPLFKSLRKEDFRFFIVFFEHYSLAERLEAEVRLRHADRPATAIDCRVATYEQILSHYLEQQSGFIFLHHFQDVIQLQHDSEGRETSDMRPENDRRRGITVGLNLRRDRLATFPIALFLMVGPYPTEYKARPLMEKMPDLWSFRSLILDLKLDRKPVMRGDGAALVTMRSLENPIEISSLGGNTAASKRKELAKLEAELSRIPVTEQVLRMRLQEQVMTLLRELGEEDRLRELQVERNRSARAISSKRGQLLQIKIAGLQPIKLLGVEAIQVYLPTLTDQELQLLSIFSVLPSEWIPFIRLEALLTDFEELEDVLLSLVHKGLLGYEAETVSFKMREMVRQIARKQNEERIYADAEPLIDALVERLEYDSSGHITGSSYADAGYYARLGEVVVTAFPAPYNQIAILNDRLGNYYTTLGDLGKALGYFEEQNRLSKELHAAYPGKVGFKNDLAVSYSKLGNTHAELGDLGKALEYFEEFNGLENELHAAYPDNVRFKSNLAISYSNLGNTHAELGDLGKALGYFEEQNSLVKELHAAYPDNVDFKNSMAISYSKLGETYAAQGDLDKALRFFEEQNPLFKELFTSFPDNVGFKNGLAVSYWKLGDLGRKMNDKDKARHYFSQCKLLLEELVTAFPAYVQFAKNLEEVRRDLEGMP